MTQYDAILDPVMMTQYDAILDPVMMTQYDAILDLVLMLEPHTTKINNEESSSQTVSPLAILTRTTRRTRRPRRPPNVHKFKRPPPLREGPKYFDSIQ